MKLNKVNLLTLLTIATFSASIYANGDSRLSGEIALATGVFSTNSNLNTDTPATLRDHSNQGKRQDEFVAIPLGHLAYDLGELRHHRVYLGTSRDDIAVGDLAFEIGYQYDFINGTQLDVAFLPTAVKGEAWSNPYLLGQQRQVTDVDGHAFRLKLNDIMGSGLSLDMAYAKTEIDNEAITDSTLLRDSHTYYVKGAYLKPLNGHSGIISSLAYTHADAEGKAETYNQYKGELTYFSQFDRQSISLTGAYTYRDYDGASTTFNHRARSDDKIKLFVAYEYTDFAGWDNWSLISLAGANFTRSNIDFYESDEYLATVGLSFKF
ncbi:DUF2860 family protein [Thaumasiovibrio subtropicus]|uniref:DUF2860 family protein n=1 Tax=Thaumasiovibrio subtropicus TaxID=1891207 RepID=UPI000B36260E|nr:DUF2860 family protein [Thaumasiovibrio subtropicus]